MLAAVRGYYDGTQIIVDEDDRKNLSIGDELIITILNQRKRNKDEIRAEKRRELIESGTFVKKTGRTVEEIDHYLKELRNDDRF